MGFAISEGPLWERYRDEFPVCERLTYLNHAAVSPLPRRVAEAMKRFADDACEYGSIHYEEWLQAYEDIRLAAARLVGAHRDEIALVKNTSEGICTVAGGLHWQAGDKVVAFREEFPANYFPWKRLEAKGVVIEWLSVNDPLECVREACRRARLLSISFIQYLSGLRANLKAIGDICRESGCFFFVDAIQGLGAFPLAVEEAHVDAFAADGHKWLLGAEGCGILYVRREWQDRIEPIEYGWTNAAHFADYASRDMTLRADAGRYECGTLTTIACFGLREALKLILELDPARIGPVIQARADELAAGALGKGYEVLGDRSPERGSGIVTVRHPSLDCRKVVAELKTKAIIAAPRQGWIRFSPHFYISPEAIRSVVDALPGA